MNTPTTIFKIKEEKMIFGKNIFTMKHFKRIKGHDDCLPYEAVLYMNNKPICKCFNDGWGSSAMLTPNTDNKKFYDMADNHVMNFDIEYNGKSVGKYTLSDIADELAAIINDNKITWRKVKDEQMFNLIFKKEYEVQYRFFKNNKGMKLSLVYLSTIEQYRQRMEVIINEMKEQGYELLNWNL